jgi:membrane protein DedA with SNARE-associated domain
MVEDASQPAEPEAGTSEPGASGGEPADGNPAGDPRTTGDTTAAANGNQPGDDAPPTDGDPSTPGTAGSRPSRRLVATVAIPLVALVIASYIGDAAAPTLVDSHPALLIALNARNRNLILATNSLDAWTYYGIGTVRLLLSDPLFFLLGYWYGDAAVRWMERRTKTWGEMLRQVEQWFGKAAYPLIFVAPNNAICLFAGAAGMPLKAFFAVNVAGTVTRLYLIRRFGEAFESPIDDFVGWIGDNRGPLLIVTVALVVISIGLEAKRGETEVTSLARLDEELEAEANAGAGAERAGPDRAGPERAGPERPDGQPQGAASGGDRPDVTPSPAPEPEPPAGDTQAQRNEGHPEGHG